MMMMIMVVVVVVVVVLSSSSSPSSFRGALFLQRNSTMFSVLFYTNGQGSSAGIATGYGLDGPGIESRWRRDFPHLSRPALGPTQPPV
jgi:hypothetical protein